MFDNIIMGVIQVKSTGIVRKVDDLGRIVIPKELRKTMNIKKKDPMGIFVEGDNIIFSKYTSGCIFCGEIDDTFEFKGNTICYSCFKGMNKEAKYFNINKLKRLKSLRLIRGF